MLRVAVLLLLLAVLVLPMPAYAESFVSDMGPPKGVVGYDGIRCVGEVQAGGNSYRMVQYYGADPDEPVAKEHAWQEATCNREMPQDMTRWLAQPYNGEYCLLWNPTARIPGYNEPSDLYCYRKPGVSITPGDVKVTIQRL